MKAIFYLLPWLLCACSQQLVSPLPAFQKDSFWVNTDPTAAISLLEPLLPEASRSIHCAFSQSAFLAPGYGGPLAAVADSLQEKSRLLSVKIYTDLDESLASGALLARENLILAGNGGDGVMRNNFCLVDDAHIWFSTVLAGNPAAAVSFIWKNADPNMIESLQNELVLYQNRQFGLDKKNNGNLPGFSLEEGQAAIYSGPQENPLQILIAAILGARHQIRFFSSSLQNNSSLQNSNLADALNTMAGLGLEVGGMVEQSSLFEEAATGSGNASALPQLHEPIALTLLPGQESCNYEKESFLSHACLQLFVLDAGEPSARALLYNGSARSRADNSDDGLLLEFSDPALVSFLASYLDSLKQQGQPLVAKPDPASSGIIINEIHWMGTGTDYRDEFVELYNQGPNAVNVSGWKFACSTNGQSSHAVVELPAGTIIEAGQYYVISARAGGAFPRARLVNSALAINNDSFLCLLTDSGSATGYLGFDGSDANSSLDGHFDNALLRGQLADQAGEGYFFGPASLSLATDLISLPAHGLKTGQALRLLGNGSVPNDSSGSLVNGSLLYVIKTGADSLKLAKTRAQAFKQTAINFTSPGSGDFLLALPFSQEAGEYHSPSGMNQGPLHRSMERISGQLPGERLGSWQSNFWQNQNNPLPAAWREQVFASPGQKNSSHEPITAPLLISELQFYGSYTDSGVTDHADDFIEIYNPGNQTVDISGLQLACSNDNGSLDAHVMVTLPPASSIGPFSYFVIAAKNRLSAPADHVSYFAVATTVSQCILTSGSGTGPWPATAYLRGNILDTLGSGSLPLASYNLGLNKTSLPREKRSVERVSFSFPGNLPAAWATNRYLPGYNPDILAGYQQQTFASPGHKNSWP